MGKNKPSKRFNVRRPNPTGAVYDGEFALNFDEGNPDSEFVPGVITNIIEQLNDPSKEERAYGCQHMSRVVSQPKAVEFLLQQDAIKITAPLFLDSCEEVQKSALGAMRNMSVFGDENVCDLMVKNDVITPLSVVIKKFGGSFDLEQKASKHEIPSEILLEAVELLSNLCENNSKAFQIFNKEKILLVLLPLLNPDICGYPLANAIAHCLHVVSENNVEVSRVCKQPDVLSRLVNIVTSPHSCIDQVLFKARIIGIVLNLSEIDLSQYYDSFIKAIGEVLDMDCLPLISLEVERTTLNPAEENDKTDVDLSHQDIDKLIAAQRVSLETVANLCCNDDDWEEMEEDGGEDLCEEVDECGDGMGPEEEGGESLCLPSEIHSAFVKHNFLTKIMQKAQPLDQQQVALIEPLHCGRIIIERFEDLQARALLCLSNLISAVCDASASEPQSTPVVAIWTQLYGLAKAYQGKNEDFMWAVTSALRAVLQKLAEMDKQQLMSVSQEDLEFLIQLGTVSTNPETQINVIRMVSTIGCVLALDAAYFHIVKTIGEMLLQVCRANEDLAVVSETLDSLFDVFQEDETDPVATQIGLVTHLKTIQTAFKAKVMKERKTLGQSHGIVMMARSNLAAFLKYKLARRL